MWAPAISAPTLEPRVYQAPSSKASGSMYFVKRVKVKIKVKVNQNTSKAP